MTATGALARAGLIVSSAFLVSRVLGYVRVVVIANAFASTELDAFFAAFRIPDLIFQLVAAGALSSALIPIISGTVHDRRTGPRLAGRVDRDQPDAHRPARLRGRAVHPRAGHRPDHHARLQQAPSSTRPSS